MSFFGSESFIKGSRLVDVQIVHNKNNLFNRGIYYIYQILYLLCPVNCSPMFTHSNMVSACQWFNHCKDTACSFSFILRIHFFIISKTHCLRIAYISQGLVWFLIHTDNRMHRVIRTLVYIKDILHGGNEFRISYRWQVPILAAVWFKFIFLTYAKPYPC